MTNKPKASGVQLVAIQEVRGLLAPASDIANSVGFQNDINGLLARLEETRPPWRAESSLFAPNQKAAARERSTRMTSAQRRARRAPTLQNEIVETTPTSPNGVAVAQAR